MARGAVPKAAVDKTVASNIRRLRERAGLSQAELAAQMAANSEFASWNSSTVSKVELIETGANQRRVLIAEAVALAAILGVTVNDLSTPFIEGSELYQRAVATGEQLAALLAQLSDDASSVLAKARDFEAVHRELDEAGEFSSDDLLYSPYVRNLDDPILNSVRQVQKSARRYVSSARTARPAIGEWTLSDGEDIDYQTLTGQAQWQWENSDKDEVVRTIRGTGESPIEGFSLVGE